MTSRERVLAAMDHKPVDRVPRVFKATPEVDAQLVGELRLDSLEELKAVFCVENLHWPFYRAKPRHPGETDPPEPGQVDRWGITRQPVDYGAGVYYEYVVSPIASASTVREIEAYPWPDPDDLDFCNVSAELDAWQDKARAAPGISVFEVAWQMRGYQRFMEDLLLSPDLVAAMLERIEAYWTEVNNRLWEIGQGRFDIFMAADDFGTQQSLMMSRDTWLRYFGPIYRRAFAWAKERGLRTMLHCDGATRAIIPDLIGMGLDVLDPAQPLAEGMDPYEIKQEFGKDLCIHGTMDVQRLLPFGAASEVEREVRRQIEVLGQGSGFILAPSHCIQPGTPVENILAMYRAADEAAG